MLAQLKSREALERAVAETTNDVNTIYFPFSIQGFLEDSFPESPIRVFVYPARGPRKYWFMIKDNEHIKFEQFPNVVHLFDEERCLRSGRKQSELGTFLHGRKAVPTCAQRGRTRHVDPFSEGELINNTWQHAKEGDLEQTIAKLARLPSACVRHKGTPVAFEMLDPAGFFNNQYVFPEHRRKGLGGAVETKLIQQCVNIGMKPYKTVSRSNQSVLAATYSSSQWTHWKENDRPVV
ncbi:unnamed protein product, partial [Strongylus vulgaris]